jgi:hypothetical protein
MTLLLSTYRRQENEIQIGPYLFRRLPEDEHHHHYVVGGPAYQEPQHDVGCHSQRDNFSFPENFVSSQRRQGLVAVYDIVQRTSLHHTEILLRS